MVNPYATTSPVDGRIFFLPSVGVVGVSGFSDVLGVVVDGVVDGVVVDGGGVVVDGGGVVVDGGGGGVPGGVAGGV
jgi:hypothetical protein